MEFGDDAGAIGVAEDEVVELGDEAHWGGRVLGWARGFRDVEQDALFGILELQQFRLQGFEYGLCLLDAGPGLEIRDRGGSESSEVAEDERLRVSFGIVRVGVEIELGIGAESPWGVRIGKGGEREMHAYEVAHGALIAIGERCDQFIAQASEGAGAGSERLAGGFQNERGIEGRQTIAEDRLCAGGEHGLQDWPPGGEVARSDQVQRSAEGGRAQDFAGVDGFEELLAFEGFEAGPQADEGWACLLGLESTELFDDGDGIRNLALQEHLAGQ